MLSITKLQNLKAIHNNYETSHRSDIDVINHKTTKFESNSQLISLFQQGEAELLSITKLQNLKAIHNALKSMRATFLVVINHKTTKFESNSQLCDLPLLRHPVVINQKTTKFESNSQLLAQTRTYESCCYQSQNYKI